MLYDVSAEIIAIGTELLLGETADTNTCFIARALRGLGVNLFRATTVGDNADRIAQAIREALGRSGIVITTGGLGPTVDDPTRQAVAQAVDVELVYRPKLWKHIAARIARYGRTPTENQKRQAYIPMGAIAIENPVGTAPAFIVETGRYAIISLPGVPREMETLLTQTVIPYLQKRYELHEIIKIRNLHAGGVGEAWVDEQIGDLEALTNPTVGLSAHSGIIDIRITAKAGSEAEADQMLAEIEVDVRERLGTVIYGVDDDTLEAVTLKAVAARGWSLACLESGLDGTLIERLARVKNPAYLGGSRIAVQPYALEQALEEVCGKNQSSVALGVALSFAEEQQTVTILILMPQGKDERRLTYGGHPRNAPRWATNMGLDSLRRQAQGISD
ncbi:MAG: CinA family nicotinamide mononucleotide deamidase-related protein [Anaerolineales bacterium]|nr:CinA family nicotinamide mononucleotide deamidase-related protein [Anaerolineales bacterium]